MPFARTLVRLRATRSIGEPDPRITASTLESPETASTALSGRKKWAEKGAEKGDAPHCLTGIDR